MQRGSAGTMRMVIIVSALGFLMLGVLYVMKRGEVSRLKIDVRDHGETQRTLQSQVESLTMETGELQSRLVKETDEKNQLTADKARALKEAEEEILRLRDEMQALRENQDSAEEDLEDCENEGLKCDGEMKKLRAQLSMCQNSKATCDRKMAAAEALKAQQQQQQLALASQGRNYPPANQGLPGQAYPAQQQTADALTSEMKLRELQARLRQHSLANGVPGNGVPSNSVPGYSVPSNNLQSNSQGPVLVNGGNGLFQNGGGGDTQEEEEEEGGFDLDLVEPMEEDGDDQQGMPADELDSQGGDDEFDEIDNTNEML